MIGNLIATATPLQKTLGVVIGAVALVLLTLGVLGIRKEKPVTALPDTLQGARVPPIDAAAPANTETATFALG